MHVTAAQPNHLALLSNALKRDESQIDPVYGGLLVALPFYPGLQMDDYLGQVDALAARARARLGRARTPHRVIAAINGALFEEAGFYGSTQDYYDPRNSFLNEVLERKTGIPIALSAIYLGVARRLRQPIVGVGMPLHFVVKYVGERHDFYIDPFQGGEVITEDQCRKRVQDAYGAPVQLQPDLLDETPMRSILFRMLNNLKFAFLKAEDYGRAGVVVDQMLVVNPSRTDGLRDRGLLYLHERKWTGAADYLSRYLQLNADAPDANIIQQQLHSVLGRRARRN